DALNPRHLVSRIDAILLTGGSAYGLGAADGVMRWLRERRRGLPLGPAGVVPIVPTAVIFDFDLGPGGKADRWPTADDAYRAGGARPPHRALRHAVRRRRCLRREHRRDRARDAAPGGGVGGAGGAGGGGARGAAGARARGRARTGRRCRAVTERLERDVGDLARKGVPDPRLGVVAVGVLPAALTGCTTSRDALEELRRIAAAARRAADIRLLPDGSVRDEPAGVTTAAVAPLLREPRIAADRVSERLTGEPF